MGTIYFLSIWMKSMGTLYFYYMDEKYGDPILLSIWMRSMGTLYFYYMDEKYGDPILLLYG